MRKLLAFVLVLVSLLAFGAVGVSAASDEALAKQYLKETKELLDGDHTLRAVSRWEGSTAQREQVFMKYGESEAMYWPDESCKLLRTVSVSLPDETWPPTRTIYPGLRLYGDTTLGYATHIWNHLDEIPKKPLVVREGDTLKVTVPKNSNVYGPGDGTFIYTNGVLTNYEYPSEVTDFTEKWEILSLSAGADETVFSTKRMLNMPLFIKLMQFIDAPLFYLMIML